MAYITLNRAKLKHNYHFLNQLFSQNGIDWAVVSKILCGNKIFLTELLNLGIKEVCDSRVANLKVIKEINPTVQTVFIKPPAPGQIEEVVRYADVSFNTESETIRLLSEEAQRQGKVHKITIMLELGDLREGIMGEHLIEFYDSIFKLPNIKVTSIGANLNCLHGVMPSEDKLLILSLYKQLLDAKFNQSIPWVTGGTSVVLPLLFRKQVPKSVNHFRVGEALYFGNDLFDDKPIEGMATDIFKLHAEIIEITKKPKNPNGLLGSNPSGEVAVINDKDYGKYAYRAILDLGLLDIHPDHLIPDDNQLSIVNASSDMLVIDLGKNANDYAIGDKITFQPDYMGVLRLLSSDYIQKKFSTEQKTKKYEKATTINSKKQLTKQQTKPIIS